MFCSTRLSDGIFMLFTVDYCFPDHYIGIEHYKTRNIHYFQEFGL